MLQQFKEASVSQCQDVSTKQDLTTFAKVHHLVNRDMSCHGSFNTVILLILLTGKRVGPLLQTGMLCSL